MFGHSGGHGNYGAGGGPPAAAASSRRNSSSPVKDEETDFLQVGESVLVSFERLPYFRFGFSAGCSGDWHLLVFHPGCLVHAQHHPPNVVQR